MDKHKSIIQICDICEKKACSKNCHQCKQNVCNSAKCVEKFPDYNNETYILCMDCVEEIEAELILLDPKTPDIKFEMIYEPNEKIVEEIHDDRIQEST